MMRALTPHVHFLRYRRVLTQETEAQEASWRQTELSRLWLFSLGPRSDHSVVQIKETALFTTALHEKVAYLPTPLRLSASNNLCFLYLWKITSF